MVVRTRHQLSVICPEAGQGPVHLYSNPLNSSSPTSASASSSDLQSILVKLTGQGPAPVLISWLEFTPEPAPSALTGAPRGVLAPACDEDYRCPRLGCVSPSLWCDGTPDCPGGWDEKEPACAALIMAPASTLLAGLSAVGVVFVLLLATLLVLRFRSAGGRSLPPAEPCKRASNGTVETMLNHKDHAADFKVTNGKSFVKLLIYVYVIKLSYMN